MTADNIIDHRYFRTMLPELARRGLGLRLFFEVKANMKREHVEALRAAGVMRVQPGIESLDDDVLGVMRKGVTALQNVQTLKLCKESGIAVTWNLLMGFPNEDPRAYDRMARLIPLLAHLPPPEMAAPIRLDRFSPFFDDPAAFGMTNVRPAPAYADVYGGSRESLARLAYYFEFDYADGRDVATYTADAVAAVRRWRAAHEGSDLCILSTDAGQLVIDRRPGAPRPFLVLTGVERTVHEACDEIADVRAVLAAAAAAHPETPADDVLAACSRLAEAGLLLEQGGRYLSLAVTLEHGASRALRDRLAAGLSS
jgi:ribosomal peptide maturation radical SAM protein 1